MNMVDMKKDISADTPEGWGKRDSGGMEKFKTMDGKDVVAIYYIVNLDIEYQVKGKLTSVRSYLLEQGYRIPSNIKKLKLYSFMLDEMLNENERFAYSVVDFPFARGAIYDVASTSREEGEEEGYQGMRQLEEIRKMLSTNFGGLEQSGIDEFFEEFNDKGDTWVLIEGHGHSGANLEVGEQNPNPIVLDKITGKFVRGGIDIKSKVTSDPSRYKQHPINKIFSVGNKIEVETLLQQLGTNPRIGGVSVIACNLGNSEINNLFPFPVSYIYGNTDRPKATIINPHQS